MKNLFKFSLCVIAATTSLFVGCSKDYSGDIDKLKGEVKELQDLKSLLGGKVITNIEQDYTENGVRGTRITYTPITGGTASYAFIPNGAKGDKGEKGATPVISIIDGKWAVDGVKTTQAAQGPAGVQGPKGETGAAGATGPIGPSGATGATGANGDYVKVDANTPDAGSTTITVMDGTTNVAKGEPVVVKNGDDGSDGSSITARVEGGALKVYKVVDGQETLVGQIKAPEIETVYDYAENIGKMTIVITNYNFDGTEVTPKQYIKTDLPEDTNSLVRYITTAGPTDDFYTFELGDGTKMRVLRRMPAIPQSVTILTEKVVINRYGEAVVVFRVNPSNVIITDKQYLDLDYVPTYTRSIAGNEPTNVAIKEMKATAKQGEYELTLAWKNPQIANTDVEPIFLIVNYTDPNDEKDVKDLVSVTSSTPIMSHSSVDPITANTIVEQDLAAVLSTDTYSGVVELNDPTLKPAVSNLILSLEVKKDPSTVKSYINLAHATEYEKVIDPFVFTVKFDDAAATVAQPNWNYVGFNVNADFNDIDAADVPLKATVIPMVINRKAYTLALADDASMIPGTTKTATIADDVIDAFLAGIKTCDAVFTQIAAFAPADYDAATMTTTVVPASAAITATFDATTREYKVVLSDAAVAGDYDLTSVLSIAGREVTITKKVTVTYPIYSINVKSDANFTAALPAPFAALTDASLTTVWKSVSDATTADVKLGDVINIQSLTHNNTGIVYQFKNDLGLVTPITTVYTFTGDKFGDMADLTNGTKDQMTALFVELSTGQVLPVRVCKAGATGATLPIVVGNKSNELNILIYNTKAKEVAIDVTGGATSFVFAVNRPDADLNWDVKVNDYAAVDMLIDTKNRIPAAGKPVYTIDRMGADEAISAIDAATGKLTFSKTWSPRAEVKYTITVTAKDIWGTVVSETQEITVTDPNI